MDERDPAWTARHVKLMRTQRGHWCCVPGCTGSQPLMTVPTEREVWAERQPRGVAVDWLPSRHPLAFLRRAT